MSYLFLISFMTWPKDIFPIWIKVCVVLFLLVLLRYLSLRPRNSWKGFDSVYNHVGKETRVQSKPIDNRIHYHTKFGRFLSCCYLDHMGADDSFLGTGYLNAKRGQLNHNLL
jgi:hypothetical protein